MNRKEKESKKEFIRSAIDLSNGRYKDDEVDILYDIVSNRNIYDGKSETYKHSFDAWCSEGKYHRDESTTYTLKDDKHSIYIEENYHYKDDDGQTGGMDRRYRTGRELLNVYKKIFRD